MIAASGTFGLPQRPAPPGLESFAGTGIDGHTVTWPDGAREHVDAILRATGYEPALSYLDPAERTHSRGLSTVHPGLGYVVRRLLHA